MPKSVFKNERSAVRKSNKDYLTTAKKCIVSYNSFC